MILLQSACSYFVLFITGNPQRFAKCSAFGLFFSKKNLQVGDLSVETPITPKMRKRRLYSKWRMQWCFNCEFKWQMWNHKEVLEMAVIKWNNIKAIREKTQIKSISFSSAYHPNGNPMTTPIFSVTFVYAFFFVWVRSHWNDRE